MLSLFDAFTSTHNMFGLCTSTQDFTSIYAIRLNIIRNNHHCRLFHFDSDFDLDSFTSTLDFTSIHSLRTQVSLRFIHFGNSKRKKLSFMSIHALRQKELCIEVLCTSTQKILHFDPTPSTQSFTSTHSLREGKSIEVHASQNFTFFTSVFREVDTVVVLL